MAEPTDPTPIGGLGGPVITPAPGGGPIFIPPKPSGGGGGGYTSPAPTVRPPAEPTDPTPPAGLGTPVVTPSPGGAPITVGEQLRPAAPIKGPVEVIVPPGAKIIEKDFYGNPTKYILGGETYYTVASTSYELGLRRESDFKTAVGIGPGRLGEFYQPSLARIEAQGRAPEPIPAPAVTPSQMVVYNPSPADVKAGIFAVVPGVVRPAGDISVIPSSGRYSLITPEGTSQEYATRDEALSAKERYASQFGSTEEMLAFQRAAYGSEAKGNVLAPVFAFLQHPYGAYTEEARILASGDAEKILSYLGFGPEYAFAIGKGTLGEVLPSIAGKGIIALGVYQAYEALKPSTAPAVQVYQGREGADQITVPGVGEVTPTHIRVGNAALPYVKGGSLPSELGTYGAEPYTSRPAPIYAPEVAGKSLYMGEKITPFTGLFPKISLDRPTMQQASDALFNAREIVRKALDVEPGIIKGVEAPRGPYYTSVPPEPSENFAHISPITSAQPIVGGTGMAERISGRVGSMFGEGPMYQLSGGRLVPVETTVEAVGKGVAKGIGVSSALGQIINPIPIVQQQSAGVQMPSFVDIKTLTGVDIKTLTGQIAPSVAAQSGATQYATQIQAALGVQPSYVSSEVMSSAAITRLQGQYQQAVIAAPTLSVEEKNEINTRIQRIVDNLIQRQEEGIRSVTRQDVVSSIAQVIPNPDIIPNVPVPVPVPVPNVPAPVPVPVPVPVPTPIPDIIPVPTPIPYPNVPQQNIFAQVTQVTGGGTPIPPPINPPIFGGGGGGGSTFGGDTGDKRRGASMLKRILGVQPGVVSYTPGVTPEKEYKLAIEAVLGGKPLKTISTKERRRVAKPQPYVFPGVSGV